MDTIRKKLTSLKVRLNETEAQATEAVNELEKTNKQVADVSEN